MSEILTAMFILASIIAGAIWVVTRRYDR